MEKIIEVKNLYKNYGNVEAVKGLDFYVEKGKLFAFLGPNGAGKSTTIDIICTLLKQDKGEILIDGLTVGKDDDKIRQKIGVVFQDSILDKNLTVFENLKIRGSFYKIPNLKEKIGEVSKEVGLDEFLNRRYGKLSGGQRRRTDIARALINEPEILFLDEPTTGLDPQTRKNVWDTIKRLQTEKNMTVFLTTHYMEEAEEADFVIVIDKGEIAAKGTPNELKEKYASNYMKMRSNNSDEIFKILDELNKKYKVVADTIIVNLDETKDAIEIMEKCKDLILWFEVVSGTMDDAFIGITGKEIRS